MRKHYVVFLSPGTFVCEETSKSIDAHSPMFAVAMAKFVVERYNARPFGFYFTTALTVEPVPDGEGGTLDVREKEVYRSGMYFLGGTVRTLDDVERFAGAGESILLSNMRGNGWWVIVENANPYKITRPFDTNDVIVDLETGTVVRRGDEPALVVYRAAKDAARKQEFSSLTS